jgi:membrane protease subunit (stomatin/prohibitin family)
MAFWDKLKGELIDIIEWLDSSQDVMVYRFERHNNEIKYGAKLVVREGQAAVFINEGRAEQPKPETWNVMDFKPGDVFEPGMYTLDTKNLPILSTLQGWKYGFESPFKAEVYFFNTRQFPAQKWGTPNPIMLRDPEFGIVRLRAFGTYTLRIKDPLKFLREIVGTRGLTTTEAIGEELRSMILTRFTDVIGESKIPALDLAANYNELGEFVAKHIRPEFENYGLELSKLLVSNISLPDEVTKAMDKRASMGALGNLNDYMKYQAADALGKAAETPGGLAGAGMALGAGMGLGNAMQQAMNAPNAPAVPPPLPKAVQFHAAINGQSAGPFDMAGLQQQVKAGAINRETLVWREGMPDWHPASQVPELNSLFGSMPPPLPKQ